MCVCVCGTFLKKIAACKATKGRADCSSAVSVPLIVQALLQQPEDKHTHTYTHTRLVLKLIKHNIQLSVEVFEITDN